MSRIINTDGIVIQRREAGDSSFYLKILTAEHGLIDVTARGVKKQGASNAALSQLYTCARYSLSISKGRYYINSGELIKTFYSLRLDLKLFALASFFSEAVLYTVTENQTANDIYRLFANCMYMLCEKGCDPEYLRFIFQLRLMSDLGFLPGLIGCRECNRTESKMYFAVMDGSFYCRDHIDHSYKCYEITDQMMEAMRFVCLTSMDRLFNFRISPRALAVLCDLSEKYMYFQTGRKFDTLDYYKGIE